MLAEMAIEVEAMRLLTTRPPDARRGRTGVDRLEPREGLGGDHAMRITTDAVQVFGGYGYMKEYPVEKPCAMPSSLQIYEGTSQVQRIVIARNL
jgi:acyl-CoA dehydrogenase